MILLGNIRVLPEGIELSTSPLPTGPLGTPGNVLGYRLGWDGAF